MPVSREAVIWGYRMLLGREPESEAAVDSFSGIQTMEELRRMFLASEEFAASQRSEGPNPFWHYNANFDAIAIIRRHAAGDQTPKPTHLLSYFGVAINPKFFPTILDGRQGSVEDETVPANWHADIAEFAAALRAVEFARENFTVVELGCGWGCWMNLTGVAARRLGLKVTAIGIEGDPGHVGFAREALADNGFTPEQVTIHHGIAAATGGVALFPHQDVAGEAWGLEPIFGASDAQRTQAVASGKFQELPMVSLQEAAADQDRVDLLHIDIQGGEAKLVAESLPFLNDKVAYMLIGTHSREIEGQLFDTMFKAGWKLDIERPAIYHMHVDPPTVRVDGVQAWINPALLPA